MSHSGFVGLLLRKLASVDKRVYEIDELRVRVAQVMNASVGANLEHHDGIWALDAHVHLHA